MIINSGYQSIFILGGILMKRITLTENLSYEEWLALRKTGIGGSDASVIMQRSPFKSVLELWYEKTGKMNNVSDESEAAYWGKKLEAVVREEFTSRTGLHVYIEPYLLQHEEHVFMQANLDGFLYDTVYGPCVFEAKTASAYKASDWEFGVPEEYYAQLQHYMAVTGYKGAYIAALIGGNKFVWKFVERDESYIKTLVQKEQTFWNLVQAEQEPPIDSKEVTAEFLAKMYPKVENTETLALDVAEQQWIDLYYAARFDERVAKEQKELAENNLKALLQNHGKAVLGNVEIHWPMIVSEKFDSKQLKIDEPELYAQYAYKTSYRKFSVKESEGGNKNAE